MLFDVRGKKHPELVFGLVGPIGVNMDDVESKLCASLQTVGYEPISIRATEIMQQVDVGIEIKHSADPLTHYQTRIDYANAVRRKCNNDAAIAGLVMLHIRQLRYDINSQILSNKELESENASEIPLQKHAFVIRQFKRKEEIDALKKVYGSKFIQLSANARQEERLKGLSRRMASQNPNLDKDTCDKYAEQLIERDLNEITVNWGQRIGDVFHLGDVFVDANTEVLIEKNIRRFVEAFLGVILLVHQRTNTGLIWLHQPLCVQLILRVK
ncbi:hypothetical protein [Fodinicurvata halophila]|uniref:hypothetical protein n=1 Tax=Fodinicurvata halophila TaxID=1419723 RepID=UPI0036383062